MTVEVVGAEQDIFVCDHLDERGLSICAGWRRGAAGFAQGSCVICGGHCCAKATPRQGVTLSRYSTPDKAAFDDLFAINVKGTFLTLQKACRPSTRARQPGHDQYAGLRQNECLSGHDRIVGSGGVCVHSNI
jgi:NAD(P)-dependent dehydrogenase (short-subunit alcohol dehydrogenase family)